MGLGRIAYKKNLWKPEKLFTEILVVRQGIAECQFSKHDLSFRAEAQKGKSRSRICNFGPDSV